MAKIVLNTDQVNQIASDIDNLNKQLKEELEKSKKSLNSLSNLWVGEAANATRESYDLFATKYFQNYYDVIDQYVNFLKVNVAQGYAETENINIGLAGEFK